MKALLMLWLFASSAMFAIFFTKVVEVSGYHVNHDDYYYHDHDGYHGHHGHHGYNHYPDHYDYHHYDHHDYTGNDHAYDYELDHNHHQAPVKEMKFCSSHPCQNGGTCVADGYNFFCNCTCDYQGKYCQKKRDICHDSNPCKNGASCSQIVVDGTCQANCTCTCDKKGANCTEERNRCDETNPCKNGATCSQIVANGKCLTKCTCPCDSKGPNCTEERNHCHESNPCRNGATCSQTVSNGTCKTNCACTCDRQGDNCTKERNHCDESNPCQNGATCSQVIINGTCQTNCTCTCDYKGPNCTEEIDFCTENSCKSGYFCVKGSCEHQCVLGCNITTNSIQPIENLVKNFTGEMRNLTGFVKLYAYLIQRQVANCTQWCVEFTEFLFAMVASEQAGVNLDLLVFGFFDKFRDVLQMLPDEDKAKILPVFDKMREDCQGQPPKPMSAPSPP